MANINSVERRYLNSDYAKKNPSWHIEDSPWKCRQMPDYDYWLRLGLLGDFIHVRKVLASFHVHPGSQTYGAVSEERAEELVRILTAIFQDPRIPDDLAALRDRAVSRAFLISAQLHLRAGRGAAALACVRRAAALYPSNLFSLRSARALVNAIFNRFGHRLLWTVRHALRGPARDEPGGDRRHS